jgi:hypothetical protein
VGATGIEEEEEEEKGGGQKLVTEVTPQLDRSA